MAEFAYVLLGLASNEITKIKLLIYYYYHFTVSCAVADNKKFELHETLLEKERMKYLGHFEQVYVSPKKIYRLLRRNCSTIHLCIFLLL